MKKAFVLAVAVVCAWVLAGCDGYRPDPLALRINEQFGQNVSITNGLITVDYDQVSHRFSIRRREVLALAGCRIAGDAARVNVIQRSNPLGDGSAIEVEGAQGDKFLISLYRDRDFVFLSRDLVNTEPNVRQVDAVTTFHLPILTSVPPADLRVLGPDGLTTAEPRRTLHCFAAVADPNNRIGVVGGWLTHHVASGVVTAGLESNSPIMIPRSEYGRLTVHPGQFVPGETFAVGFFFDALKGLESYADLIREANDARPRPVPSGYCTWYSSPHGGASDQEHMAELARFCKEKLVPFGFEVLQIDDKWQIASRDYTTHNPSGPYPDGMKPTAETITANGMTAGIWYIPFGWNHELDKFADRQDWFVHKADGSPYTVRWAGTCLDMTHPRARDFLRDTVSRMSREWGYKYMKIDGLWTGLAAKITYPQPTYKPDGLGDAVFHDPNSTNLEVYRSGLRLVREAAGDDVFILGCNIAQNMRTLGASFGLVDGMRVGRDIGARWEKIVPCVEMGSRLYFLHDRVWHNDPDCLMLREPLTLEQARAWAGWIALTGQLNMVSEWLPGLPPERLDLVKRSMPNHGLCARPIDLFRSDPPRIWQLTDTRYDRRFDIVGLFNWNAEEPQTIAVKLSELDLPDKGLGRYVGYEYWTGNALETISDQLVMELPPASCRIVSLRPHRPHPQVVGTSRHITQGVVDLKKEAWDPQKKILSGASQVVGDDPYTIRVALPKGGQTFVPSAVRLANAPASTKTLPDAATAEGIWQFTIVSPESTTLDWAIQFD